MRKEVYSYVVDYNFDHEDISRMLVKQEIELKAGLKDFKRGL